MAEMCPAIIAVVPTLGERCQTLKAALESVRAQRDVVVHLVVVVPSDAADARAVANDYGATIVDDPGRGLSAAVNAGVAAGRDEDFFAWLGDDDLLLDDGLVTLASLLEERPDGVVAFGACRYIDEAGRRIALSRAGDLATKILGWGPDLIPQPASLTRMDALLKAGPYDESLRFAMDLDMFLRLRSLGSFVSTKREVASFRWHADSLTVANRSKSLAESEAVKHRYLPSSFRPLAPLWDMPIRMATRLAARRVSARARVAAMEAERN